MDREVRVSQMNTERLRKIRLVRKPGGVLNQEKALIRRPPFRKPQQEAIQEHMGRDVVKHVMEGTVSMLQLFEINFNPVRVLAPNPASTRQNM